MPKIRVWTVEVPGLKPEIFRELDVAVKYLREMVKGGSAASHAKVESTFVNETQSQEGKEGKES